LTQEPASHEPTSQESAPQESAPQQPASVVAPAPPKRAKRPAVATPAPAVETSEVVPALPSPRTGGFAARANRPSDRRRSTAAPLTAAPSVDEPDTLLRDERITVPGREAHEPPTAVARTRSAAPAGLAPDEPAAADLPTAQAGRDAKPDAEQDAGHDGGHDAGEDSHEAVVVALGGGGRYGLAMDAVDEVGRPPAVTRVPGLPSWLAGVANWRGRILAVLDIRPLLGAPQAPLGRNARLVVCTRASVTIGLLTENVEGVVTVSRDATETPLVTLSGPAAALVSGHIGHALGPIALLDLDALFGLRAQLPRARRAG
jgi:purine-binding chemotaxis protein CheW